ncbi:two-component system, sensor histidine kinase YesM [Paenibacillus catalpae]|uniref:Two-component system, sensor histidine kinase YesM n=1 Tax=Paenibacillus catalpae TaxID=1045775 RepID=A0A1I2FR85_9BACL|nr:sensor histidine kinase [Paenibacillus catalpae]SFF07934.1 two-component system, sensor histidine kinase YesM [Paenibacillus catalpae]
MVGKRLRLTGMNDVPLRYKLLLIYLLCVLLPIVTINLFFYQRNSEDIRIREQDNLRKSIERASGELLGMIDESVALSRSIGGDDLIYEMIDRTYASPVEYYEEYNGFLRDRLTRYMSENIVEVRIYTDNPTMQTGANYYVMDNSADEESWIKQFDQSNGNIIVAAYEENSGFNSGRRISVISKMNTFTSFSKYSKYLRIDLNIDKINSILDRELDSLQLCLVDGRNQVVATSSGLRVPELSSFEAQSDRAEGAGKDSVIEHAIGDIRYAKDWRLIGIADTRRVDSLLHDAHRSILWLAVISTVIPSLLIFIIFRSYHYRVKKLSRHMEKARNEKFELINIQEGRDEIGGLIHTFNVMTGKITTLINDVYKLEIRQKSMELEQVRTELSMLQSQMNPHFLFNTLNALLIVCMKKGYSEVTEIISNLSLLMRQLLRSADGLVTLEEELEFTTMYLQIEKFRFGDQFDYQFEVDPVSLQMKVPRMSIQPLVENACKHGLQFRKGSRMIRVTVKLSDRALEINVMDNGVGMEDSKLKQLMEKVRTDQDMEGHVGIRNVYRRLELFYNEHARFLISSDPELGTEAGFHIPLARLEPVSLKKEA